MTLSNDKFNYFIERDKCGVKAQAFKWFDMCIVYLNEELISSGDTFIAFSTSV